jgi:hypothetical protein
MTVVIRKSIDISKETEEVIKLLAIMDVRSVKQQLEFIITDYARKNKERAHSK